MPFGVSRQRLHVRTSVPPGRSVIGVQPLNLIRLDTVKLGVCPGVQLMHPAGRLLPFDGNVYRFTGERGTTLTVGNLLAFGVVNDTAEAQVVELQALGLVHDGVERDPNERPAPELAHQLSIGLFAQELDASETITPTGNP